MSAVVTDHMTRLNATSTSMRFWLSSGTLLDMRPGTSLIDFCQENERMVAVQSPWSDAQGFDYASSLYLWWRQSGRSADSRQRGCGELSPIGRGHPSRMGSCWGCLELLVPSGPTPGWTRGSWACPPEYCTCTHPPHFAQKSPGKSAHPPQTHVGWSPCMGWLSTGPLFCRVCGQQRQFVVPMILSCVYNSTGPALWPTGDSLHACRQYLCRVLNAAAPGKRQWWRGCCGRERLAGSVAPGIRSTGMHPESSVTAMSSSLQSKQALHWRLGAVC